MLEVLEKQGVRLTACLKKKINYALNLKDLKNGNF